MGFTALKINLISIKHSITNGGIQFPEPTANLAINKNRLKVYNKDSKQPTYYLKDGTEFQIELFNPKTEPVLAKIEINGKLISQTGLILNPGQRVFLDRYIDVAKKFKFETYDVNNTEEVKKAIANNGNIKISFYNEQTPINITWTNPNYIYRDNFIKYNDWTAPVYGSSNLDYTVNNSQSETVFYTASINEPVKSSKSIETGRVEMGSNSEQKFETVDKEFYYLPFLAVEFKIMPESTKPMTVSELKTRTYCHECGSKVKSAFKFCPNCGTKM